MKSIIDPVTYPVGPDQINTGRHFFGAFGNSEKEVSANWLVRFCQQRGSDWQPFTSADINQFYQANGHSEEFWFNGLDTSVLIVLKDGQYYFTHEFVSACFAASPAL